MNRLGETLLKCWALSTSLMLVLLMFSTFGHAQLTRSDYERALDLQERYNGLVDHLPEAPKWIKGTDRLVYRESIRAAAGEKSGGVRFMVVDVKNKTTQPAFDAHRLAESLTKELGTPVQAEHLPFKTFDFEDEQRISFTAEKVHWECHLNDYACTKHHPKDEAEADDDDGYDSTPGPENGDKHAVKSPDGNWKAYVLNNNLVAIPSGSNAAATSPKGQHGEDQKKPIVLSTDGSVDNYYAISTIAWSPDSKHVAVYRIRPGYRRIVDYVESSPANQLQPIHSTMVYPKAGDVLAVYQPVLFDLVDHKRIEIDSTLFPNQFSMSPIVWWKDGRGFTFEYNQRGHQLYRIVEVDTSGKAHALVDETSKTFVNYEPLERNQFDHGKYFRRDLADGKEILWGSERDGWEHLYLLDGKTGAVRQQITKGAWVVRSVDYVDEQHRIIYFSASGIVDGEDPYYVHGYKIHFDGTGLAPLTPEPADHALTYSTDGHTFADLYSTVNTAPILVLRSATDGAVLMHVQTADLTQLIAAGWRAPEPFHALGRDGTTEIWGVLHKPDKLDAGRKYPVIENIYAGPQGSFVPKSFTLRAEPLTMLGFAVVQIDGMGTNNRSRAFHDVAWKNLKDAGFADRILWHKAVAQKYPWYDISRVGVFGTSAGGQSAMGALLFHPEFYKAAVSNSGCHDNRMDKIWWNEQWMGWPVGPQYSESSNVDNAGRLQGKLMLVVGEMDKNVDPASTYQVVDRLIKADKQFDLLVVPGGGHGAGGRYGQLKLMDFFVRNLLGDVTPDWNATTIAH